jgi:hypothetical protein
MMYPLNNQQLTACKIPIKKIAIIAILLLLCCAEIAHSCGGGGIDRRFMLISLPMQIYFFPFYLMFLPFIAIITVETLILAKKEGLYWLKSIFLSAVSYIFPLLIFIISAIITSVINPIIDPLMTGIYGILSDLKVNISHFFLDNLPIILILSLIFSLCLYLMTQKLSYVKLSLGFWIWNVLNLFFVDLFANQYQPIILFLIIVSLCGCAFIFNWINKTFALYFIMGQKHKNIAQTSFSMSVASYPILALSFWFMYGKFF